MSAGLASWRITRCTPATAIMLTGARDRRPGWLRLALGALVVMGAAVFGAKLISGFLFEVGVTDVPTFVGVAALLAGIASMACYIPARRAMAVDPVQALRSR